MSKISEKKTMKRLSILSAAQEVFLSEGYTEASMDKISKISQVTKQTVYRYFPSKIELFKATLETMGEKPETDFLVHLEGNDTKQALFKFATGFIRSHLSKEHMAVYRLLITEGSKAPELTSSFFSVGPNIVDLKLTKFFEERFSICNSEVIIGLWTAMLLAHRERGLIGMDMPTDRQIEDHALNATNFLLAAIS